MRLLFYLPILLFIVCCTQKKSNNIESVPGLQHTFLKDGNKVNPLISGFWKSVGNGYYLEARNDSILLYSYTQNFCYKEKNDYLEGLLNSQSQFSLRQDTLAIYLTDFGDRTEVLQTKKDFVQIDGLPENTIGFPEMTNLGPKELFKLYMETMRENYAFRQIRNLNWAALYEKYKDSVSTNPDGLFNTMGKVASLTKDQHTKVISEDGTTLQYSITPSAEVVKEVFMGQSEVKDLDAYFSLFFDTNYRNISDSLLHGRGRKVANGKLEWGHLSDSIGYINVHSFTGFLDNEFTREQQIDSLNFQMRNIIETFKKKEAIIVDVSFNFGGYDAAALTIASHFTDTPVISHKSQVYYNGRFYDEDIVTVYPADSLKFTKPVYVLITDISRSAAESFAMMMGSLPNVKLVGTNTLGTLSGMLGKSIGNFYATCSNQRLMSPGGHYYEAVGVEPDIRLEVFPKDNIFNGHKSAVKNIIEIIENE